MIIVANQPRFLPFLPYFRYACAGDVFDVGIHDPFTVKYHHRCLIGNDSYNQWLRLPLVGKANDLSGVPFSKIRIKSDELEPLKATLLNAHRKSRFWKENGLFLLNLITWPEENLAWYLCRQLRELITYLELPVNAYVGSAADDRAINVTQRIASQLKVHSDATIYLAGPKSAEYLDLDEYHRLTNQHVELFNKGHIEELYPFTKVSIASVLCELGKERTRELILKGLER